MTIKDQFATLLETPLRYLFRNSLPQIDGTISNKPNNPTTTTSKNRDNKNDNVPNSTTTTTKPLLPLPLLQHPSSARITRNQYGVPHIKAKTEIDLWTLNGYVHGQDRLWQIHSARRLASGRLCEFVGLKGMEFDKLMRILGLRGLAMEDWKELESLAMTTTTTTTPTTKTTTTTKEKDDAKSTLQMLKAYCSGINYYVDHHLHTFPIEFWITGERSNFEPFTVIDSLSIIRLYAFAMSFGFQHALVRHSLIEIFGEGRGGCWANTSGDYGEDDDDGDDGDNDDENGKDKGNNNSNNDHEKDNMKMKNKKEYKMPFTVDSEAFEAFRKADLSGVPIAFDEELPREQGSNWWAIHGSRTNSGKPILVGDPHLSLQIPLFWYEVGLAVEKEEGGEKHGGQTKTSSGITAHGAAPAGIPGILIGNNGFYGWVVTLGYCDVEDVFLERVRRSNRTLSSSSPSSYLYKGEWLECASVIEVIKVKNGPDVEYVCEKTCHGVILEGKAMLQYDSMKRSVLEDAERKLKCRGDCEVSGSNDDDNICVKLAYNGIPLRPRSIGMVGLRNLLHGRSFHDFDKALSKLSPTLNLNVGYADIQGHIGYVLVGEVPRRKGKRGSEMLPLVGWTGENDWDGFTPHKELPKAFDPPCGYIISANHKIVDYNIYPHYLGRVWKSGFRARAIKKELLNLFGTKDTPRKVNLNQMEDILLNVRSEAAIEFVNELRLCDIKDFDKDIEGAVQMLRNFDGVLSQESVAASLYQIVHVEVVRILLAGGCATLRVGTKSGNVELAEIISGQSFDPTGLAKMINELQGHLHINVLRILSSEGFPSDNLSPFSQGKNDPLRRENPCRWWLEQVGGKTALLNNAILTAVAKLKLLASKSEGDDWIHSEKVRWGSIHQCHFRHTISKNLGLSPGVPPFDAPSVECGGDTNTINQAAIKSLTDLTATSANVSMRMIFDLASLKSANTNLIIIPLGQSGQFNSCHYCDQTDLWKIGRMRGIATLERDVKNRASSTLIFK